MFRRVAIGYRAQPRYLGCYKMEGGISGKGLNLVPGRASAPVNSGDRATPQNKLLQRVRCPKMTSGWWLASGLQRNSTVVVRAGPVLYVNTVRKCRRQGKT